MSYGLSYQLVGGSLLGAIRHKGFIPWDDDIDVGMLRPDYDRFVQLAKNELEAPFFLQTPLTDPGRNIDYVQIRNSATTAIDLRYVDDHNTFNQGIFIDIFPIDGVGSDEVLQKQEKQQQFIRRVYGSAFKTNATGKAKIKHYVSNAIYKIAGPKNIDKKRNDIFRKVSIESSNEIGLVSFLFNNNRRNYWKKEWVLNCTNAPFEFLNVTVPIAADEVLTKTYGKGKFDYLNEYCKVVYLERTQGVSSTEIREQKRQLRMGLVGESKYLCKLLKESTYVNGLSIEAIYSDSLDDVPAELKKLKTVTDNLDIFINTVDAVYIRSFPTKHYEQIKKVLNAGKHVLCESPITLDKQQCKELFELAQAKGCILMEAIKTAYNTAFSRLVLLAKSGKIGDIVSVDATCTSLKELAANEVEKLTVWNSAFDWGPTAMLPVFEILGTNYKLKRIVTHYIDKERNFDDFTKMDFTYDNAVASIKVGMGVKSEGELIVSGTKGYIYVPAPWWKTDYFELRYENAADNRRYFYQLDGEGIRYELVAFVRAIDNGRMARYIEEYVSEAISSIVSDFHNGIDVIAIKN